MNETRVMWILIWIPLILIPAYHLLKIWNSPKSPYEEATTYESLLELNRKFLLDEISKTRTTGILLRTKL